MTGKVQVKPPIPDVSQTFNAEARGDRSGAAAGFSDLMALFDERTQADLSAEADLGSPMETGAEIGETPPQNSGLRTTAPSSEALARHAIAANVFSQISASVKEVGDQHAAPSLATSSSERVDERSPPSLNSGVPARENVPLSALPEASGEAPPVIRRFETHIAPPKLFRTEDTASETAGHAAVNEDTPRTSPATPSAAIAASARAAFEVAPPKAPAPERVVSKQASDLLHAPPAPTGDEAKLPTLVPAASFANLSPPGQIANAITDTVGTFDRPAAAVPSASPPPINVTQRGAVRVLEIELHPASLGTVTVTLSLNNEAINVTVSAADPTTAALLAADTQQISDSLANAGYTVDSVTIQATPRTDPVSGPVRSSGEEPQGFQRDEQRRSGERQEHDPRQPPRQSPRESDDKARSSGSYYV